MARLPRRPAILALSLVATATAMATCNLPQPQLPHFKVDGGRLAVAAARFHQSSGRALPPVAAYGGRVREATGDLPSTAAPVPPMTSDM